MSLTESKIPDGWEESARAASEWLYPLVVCPDCKAELRMGMAGEEEIQCTQCQRTYPWLGHIPVLIEQHNVDPLVLGIAESWNRVAPVWQDNLLNKPKAVLAAMDAPLYASAKGLVLEVGCGDGRLFKGYEEQGRKVIGLDFSAGMLSRAATGIFPLILSDAHKVPLRDDSLDTVLVPLATIRYLEYERFFREAHRLLRGGGVLAFTAWNAMYNGLRYLLKPSYRASWKGGRDVFRIKEVLDPLEQAGFVVEQLLGILSSPLKVAPFDKFVLGIPGRIGALLSRDIVIVARKID